jgi:kinesin family protein 3/17
MEDKGSKESLKVFVRVRPFLERELKNGNSFPVIDVQESEKELHAYEFLCPDLDGEDKVREMLMNPKHFQVHSHYYDMVFDDKTDQEKVYESTAASCLDYLLKGYNSTIIAYGQTGTGKTHTMEGNPADESKRGLIPRVLNDLFIKTKVEEDETPYKLTASYVQIYNENLSDLLSPSSKKNFNIREDRFKGIYVDNLSERELTCPDTAFQMFLSGAQTRVSASTKMNDLSSRSHAIFIIRMERKIDKDHKIFAKLNLVDLAGSERIRITGAKGQRLAECKRINQSLGELSNVIASLTKKNSTHIPYRNSKLTRLLEDSLGGNSHTSFIATVSPAHESFSETLSTLKFASRAKNIKNVIKLNKKNTRVKPINIFKKYDMKMKTMREIQGVPVDEMGIHEMDMPFMENNEFEEELYEDELEKYKDLLLKQRDVLITVTNKLHTKDEIIKTLTVENEELKSKNKKLKESNSTPKPVMNGSNGNVTNGFSAQTKTDIKEMKVEVDSIIAALTQQNESLDLQDIASSILNVQRIVAKLSEK